MKRCNWTIDFNLPNPMLETLSPLLPKFLYLRPGVTEVCRANWRGAAGAVWVRPLSSNCSLEMPSPGRSPSALKALPALNSSMQSKLAIGARHLKLQINILIRYEEIITFFGRLALQKQRSSWNFMLYCQLKI